MQSTSYFYFGSVNALNQVTLFFRKKEKGKAINKRCWSIEDNEGTEMCLESYGTIDVLDHCIKNAGVYHRSWKHRHAPKNHGIEMAVALCYMIYRMATSGRHGEQCKVKDPSENWEFCESSSFDLLYSDPRNRRHPGDELFRIVRQ